ncbi:MAG: PAS domain S-box protein [Planctomycetaceae bacterium]|nr:PAS domain S-box protein [Planctomycetaceae bacterium]
MREPTRPEFDDEPGGADDRAGGQAFLSAFGEALRPLADPLAIQSKASELLGKFLGVNRATYTELKYGEAIVGPSYLMDAEPLPSRFAYRAFSQALRASMGRGDSVVVGDVVTDARLTAAERGPLAAAGIAAFVGVVLIKDSRGVASFGVDSATARQWTAAEVELVREVAERTWSAVERARAESALHASEDEYRLLFNSLDQGFCTIEAIFDDRQRPIDYRFLTSNEAFVRQTGWTDAVGRSARELAAENESYWFETCGRVAVSGVAERFEHCADSRSRWFEVYAFPIGAPPRRRVGVLFNDVSARKQAGRELRESEERLRLALGAGELASWDWNIQTGDIVWSDSHYLMQGYEVGEVAPSYEAWIARVHPDDRAAAAAAIVGARDSRSAYRHEFRSLRPDGSIRWLSAQGHFFYDDSGDAVRMIGVARDVTEQRAANDALRRSERRQSFLLRLSDTLRPLADPLDIQAAAARTLGEHLGVGRVGYAEDEGDGVAVRVARNYCRGLPGIEGVYRYDDFGGVLNRLSSGRTIVQSDLGSDESLSDAQREAYAALRIGAMVVVPLAKAGKLLAVLFVHAEKPRAWSEEETALIEDTAQRVWSAVEQARAEAAFRISEQRFRSLVVPFAQAVWETNAQGEAVEDSPSWRAYTGQSVEEWFGEGWCAAVHPDDRAYALRRWRATVESGEAVSGEFRIRSVAGGWRWTNVRAAPLFDELGQIRKWVGMNIDVTDRKRAEEELRASETRLRLLIESAKDYAIFTMRPDLIVTSWSPGAEAVFGFAADEILGRSAESLFTPEDREAGVPRHEAETALQNGRAADERWHVRKDGTRFYASGVTTPLRCGDSAGFVKVARDLTERKRAEDELRLADRRKNEFLAMLGHELRNPLAAIKGGVTLLQSEMLPAESKAAVVPIIADQVEHMQRLIGDILDVARIIEGRIDVCPQKTELGGILVEAANMLRMRADKRACSLEIFGASEPILLQADRGRLLQVFTNIITNSIKYSGTNCRIDVIIERREGEGVVRVRDNGLGISPELLPHVFDLFVQSKRTLDRSEGGMGLGLHVVRKIVEMHGGSVEALSEGEGKGSEFIVRLPVEESRR